MSRKTLALPEPMGIKTIEIAPTSVYMRWSILSNHSLTTQQLKDLTFEFKTTDNKLHAECIDNEPLKEYKARLCGLCDSTRYRFQVRSKLRLDGDKVIFSKWSNRIPVETREKMEHFMVISNHGELEIESAKHRLAMFMQENKKLLLQIERLETQLNESTSNQPGHWQWDSRKIVNWIVRLQNGQFRPYEKQLRRHLKEDAIMGRDLHMVEESNLKDWGVTDFRARKMLIKQIAALTEDDDAVPETQFDPQMVTIKENEDIEQADIAQVADAVIEDEEEEEEAQDEVEEKEEENKDTEDVQEKDVDKKQEEDEDADDMISRTDPFNVISASVEDILADTSDEVKKWRYKEGMLSVHVIQATNCDNYDTDDGDDSASDPYVELELKGNYRKERTKSMLNDPNPVWKERFQLFVDDAKNDVLKARVYDHDKFTFDDKIGEVQIPIITILGAGGSLEKEYDVIGSKMGCKLKLSLRYWESKFLK